MKSFIPTERKPRHLYSRFSKNSTGEKYIQSHKIDTPLNDEFVRSRGFDSPPYDGVTELCGIAWKIFASFNTPEGIEATKQYIADESNLLTFPNLVPLAEDTLSLISRQNKLNGLMNC